MSTEQQAAAPPEVDLTHRTWDSVDDAIEALLLQAQHVEARWDEGDGDDPPYDSGYAITSRPKLGIATVRAHVAQLWAGADDTVSVLHVGVLDEGPIEVVTLVRLLGLTGLRQKMHDADGYLVRVTFEWEEVEVHAP